MSIETALPPYTVSILHRSDSAWDGVSGFLIDKFPLSGDSNTYAILRVPDGSRQAAGWYALKSEPIQRALDIGIVVSRDDGWCRGLAFLKDEQRCCADMGDAYKQIEEDHLHSQ
jgi:hypothetical protein